MKRTQIRTLILAILAFIGLVFPGLIPETAHEAIAGHAVEAIGAFAGLWAIFAGGRARAQKKGREP